MERTPDRSAVDFDYLVFIGRFEPFHNGHAAVARHALGRARKVIFLIGSADTPRSPGDDRDAAHVGALGRASKSAEE